LGEEEHHAEIIDGATAQLQPLFDHSSQAIYLYLDDHHKSCNKSFSKLLGYSSPSAWAGVKTSFPETFVAKKSQRTLVSAYKEAMEKGTGSVNDVTWKKKNGSEVKSRTILVPLTFEGHALALHFITEL
jgi:hypothetical protein